MAGNECHQKIKNATRKKFFGFWLLVQHLAFQNSGSPGPKSALSTLVRGDRFTSSFKSFRRFWARIMQDFGGVLSALAEKTERAKLGQIVICNRGGPDRERAPSFDLKTLSVFDISFRDDLEVVRLCENLARELGIRPKELDFVL